MSDTSGQLVAARAAWALLNEVHKILRVVRKTRNLNCPIEFTHASKPRDPGADMQECSKRADGSAEWLMIVNNGNATGYRG
jgi:hypothetical protein